MVNKNIFSYICDMEKILILCRGICGAGKSTFAKTLGGTHFEADQFFTDDEGNYKFDGSKIKLAHNWCLIQTQKAMEGNITIWPGIKLTINDKTNNNEIGKIFILDIDVMYDHDVKIKKILDTIENYTTYDFLKETVTLFLHNLYIQKEYRNLGLGKTIRGYTENLGKKYGYDYLSSITKKNNIFSQKINKKLE